MVDGGRKGRSRTDNGLVKMLRNELMLNECGDGSLTMRLFFLEQRVRTCECSSGSWKAVLADGM